MSDTPQWQSPGTGGEQPAASQLPPPPPPPGYQQPPGPYPPPGYQTPPGGYSAPGYQQPPPGYQAPPGYHQPPPGWTPAPKPGLVALRPLNFSDLLGGAFGALRRNPRTTFGTSALVLTLITLVEYGVVFLATFWGLSRVAGASFADIPTIMSGTIGLTVVAGLLSVLIAVFGTTLLQGLLVREIAHEVVGERMTIGGLWRSVRPRLLALLGYTLLLILGVGVLLALYLVPVISLALMGIELLGITILVGVLGGIGLVVLMVWLGTKLSLTPSGIVLERLGVAAAIRRSWQLTDGAFWKVFGVQFVVQIILSFAAQIVTLPLSFVVGILSVMLDPNQQGQFIAVMVALAVLTLLMTVIIGAVTMVASAATVTLLYVDQRIRKEGLDLTLIDYVERRQSSSGTFGAEDPFMPRSALRTAAASAPASDYVS